MIVNRNAEREHFAIPGIDHQTLAGWRDGLRSTEVWHQILDPGAESPVHYHECEEVVVATRGSGQVIVAGESHTFGPDSTLIVPAKVVHQLINTGSGPLHLIAALSASPARVFAPDGTEIPVPWAG